MASKFMRRKTWWIKFQHPATGEILRESLATHDPARAELLRERLEPRFQAVEVPDGVRRLIPAQASVAPAVQPIIQPTIVPAQQVFATMSPAARMPFDEAITAYLNFIRTENAPRHVENKISMLRRFIGSERVENLPQPADPGPPARRFKTDYPPFFKGNFMDEITPTLLQQFMDGLDVSLKTKRHYREIFHHFFQHCIKFGHYRPENFHCPNPMAALPSYLSKNRRIVFLSEEDVEKQLAALAPHPAFRMAAALMIYAGLRRSEALWLTSDAIAPDMSFLSVVNRVDEETETESSLKTGESTVTILPPLRRISEKYLPTLRTRWLVPLPKGGRWNGDAFGKRLMAHNAAAGIRWTCLHYRHTYATQRAAEGWSLLRISHEMGNSVAIVAEFYAGYMRPVEIGAPPQPVELKVVQAA